jgi:hypothetical protein
MTEIIFKEERVNSEKGTSGAKRLPEVLYTNQQVQLPLSQIKLKRGRFFNEISGNEVQPFNIILESKLARTGLDDEVTRPFKQIFEKISLLDHHKHISSGLYD